MVNKQRSRVVTFRLSADEFEKVEAAVVTGKARSISDFARVAVLTLADKVSGVVSESDQIQAINARSEQALQILLDLDARVRGLSTGSESGSEPVESTERQAGAPDAVTHEEVEG